LDGEDKSWFSIRNIPIVSIDFCGKADEFQSTFGYQFEYIVGLSENLKFIKIIIIDLQLLDVLLCTGIIKFLKELTLAELGNLDFNNSSSVSNCSDCTSTKDGIFTKLGINNTITSLNFPELSNKCPVLLSLLEWAQESLLPNSLLNYTCAYIYLL